MSNNNNNNNNNNEENAKKISVIISTHLKKIKGDVFVANQLDELLMCFEPRIFSNICEKYFFST